MKLKDRNEAIKMLLANVENAFKYNLDNSCTIKSKDGEIVFDDKYSETTLSYEIENKDNKGYGDSHIMELLKEIAANTNDVRHLVKDIRTENYNNACSDAIKQSVCQHIIGSDKANKIVYRTDCNAKIRVYKEFSYCPRCGMKL